MPEFKVGDRVRRTYGHPGAPNDKLMKGYEFTIAKINQRGELFDSDGQLHCESRAELVTPKYRQGDVYECACPATHNRMVILSDCKRGHFLDGDDERDIARRTPSAFRLIESYEPVKFLYNVFDKESATPDCEDTIAKLDALHAEFNEEDNTKEAIMPIKIETPTMLNGKNIEKYENAEIGCILRDSVEEAKAAELLAKETKSTTLKADAAKIRKDIAALTKLLDARTES